MWCATTLLKNGDFPYWRQAQYEQSLEWNPDIVVIMLGTNDSKTFNWVHADAFVPDFTEFVRSYQEIDSQPRVLLATPTPLFGDDLAPFDSKVMSQQIAPAIREVSRQLECEVVEFHDRMLALKALFPDGVHPDAPGTSVMAAILFDAMGSIPASDLSPSLTIEPNGSRVSVRWPVSGAGYVFQESPWLHEDDTSWEVSPPIAKHDGQAIVTGTRKRKPTFFLSLVETLRDPWSDTRHRLETFSALGSRQYPLASLNLQGGNPMSAYIMN